MDYLKELNFNNDEINYIESNLNNEDLSTFIVYEDRVKSIINYFQKLEIKNIKEIIIYKNNIFYESLSYIKKRFEESDNKNIVSLINEDINNFELIGL